MPRAFDSQMGHFDDMLEIYFVERPSTTNFVNRNDFIEMYDKSLCLQNGMALLAGKPFADWRNFKQ